MDLIRERLAERRERREEGRACPGIEPTYEAVESEGLLDGLDKGDKRHGKN